MSKRKKNNGQNTLFGEHWRQREKLRREYFDHQKLYGEFIQHNLFAGKILKENNVSIFDINQANKNFRNLLKLDEIKEIAGVYQVEEDGNQVQKIESIRKDNFYYAFHMPIWENLSIAERIKSLEWMFEDICQKYNIDLKHISYIPETGFESDLENLYGLYYPPMEDEEDDNTYLFININDIDRLGPFQFVHTIAHELMHARQKIYLDNLKDETKDYYSLMLASEFYDSYFSNDYIKLKPDIEFALYKISQTEKAAEFQGLKYLFKYYKYNEEKFGPNKYNKIELENLVSYTLFDFGGPKKNNKKKYNISEGIIANEEIVLRGQSINLTKLFILIKYFTIALEDAISYINDVKERIEETKDALEREKISKKQAKEEIKKCNEELKQYRADKKDLKAKISMAKAAFMDTLENGMMPEYFDESEFDILGLKENGTTDLPKWIMQHRDALTEMEFIAEESEGQKSSN